MLSRSRTARPRILLVIGVLTAVALTLLAGVASATPIPPGNEMDFSGGAGGSLSFKPAVGNVLTVKNAPIAEVTQFPGFLSFAIVGGLINLSTGGCHTPGCSISSGGTSLDFFNDGGSIKITGSVPSLPGDPSGLLLSGFWDSTLSEPEFGNAKCPVTNATFNAVTGGVGLNGCVKVTSINQTLLSDLGFPTVKTSGDGFVFETFFDVTLSSGKFTGAIHHTDMNVEPQVPVPEPATLAMLGAGLLVLGSLGRKRLLSRTGAR